MKKSNYEVEVLVNGHSLKEYLHEGNFYIEGKKKNEFSLRIRNHGSDKILAVPTVDGISVLDGKEASYNSRGYIIDGHDSITIDGWRTSDSEVAKFYFTNPQDSYGGKTNKDSNLGVIGVAVFKEVVQYTGISYGNINPYSKDWKFNDYSHIPKPNWSAPGDATLRCLNNESRESSAGANNMFAMSAASSPELGTGFGESKRSEVVTVSFTKRDNPEEVFELFYNTKEQLKVLGIDFNRPHYVTPSAFPKNGYCEPPK